MMDAEYAALETGVRTSSLTLSEWMRDVVLAASETETDY
jgi:hypothetical protein